MKLHRIYTPLTAAPFRRTEEYMEFAPCDVLKPYIRCFWGSRRAVTREETAADALDIVIPDTCMDIIYTVDFTNNRIENRFCGIDDRTFATCADRSAKRVIFVFAIRFYPWGAALFAEESLRGTRNAFLDAGCHFPKIKKEIENHLFEAHDMSQFIPVAERILQRHLQDRHQNASVFQAVASILENRGNVQMEALRQDSFVGSRQLERLFLEYVGVSPKSLAAMVRHQYVWGELLRSRSFHMADAVYRYGYADQAHLCHDFKKYHSMNMAAARAYALQSGRERALASQGQNVANIQDRLVWI